ncbi:uncharacterized protein LOC123923142 isoform X2 [Trifolium pratense]|uniref:uncharacterized protein LOC123923142 isoform X2 n=1 Tax=Trifolium pratense TaxID=57577 RepID=UPI001E69309F|nr:uncharacterized protein LOC123923142 isoform X2 [Trifolium pratense]XP_045831762.1 uncharacterized protein LOC123923142 isoform X2 [Trifolium pratense]
MKAWMKNLEKYLRSLVSLMSLLRRKLIRIRFSVDKAYQTVGVPFEVLCAVNKTEKVEEVAPEIIAAARDVQEKTEICAPFDILPLDSAGASQPIMQLGESTQRRENDYSTIESDIKVSARLLRIFGCNIVELLLVATSREHQGKGYFQVLFSCIERLLSSLNVEKLVLPAVGDAESIWTKKLGFHKMSEDQKVFGVHPISDNNDQLNSALYLQVSIISQALIFVTRSRSWSYVERLGLLLLFAFFAAEMVATLIAVYAH